MPNFKQKGHDALSRLSGTIEFPDLLPPVEALRDRRGIAHICTKTILIMAIWDLSKQDGTDLSQWRWGQMHTVTFAHPLDGRVAGMRLTRGPYPPAVGVPHRHTIIPEDLVY